MKKLDVMTAIHEGHVTMKPKWYFVVGSLLVGVGLVGAIIVVVMLTMAITFHLRTQNPLGFLRYGLAGGPVFFRLFPWKALLAALASLGIGLWLLKKYDISYRKSFAAISLSGIGMILALAFVADRTGINERLQLRPPLAPLYRQQFTQSDIIMGEVVDATDSAIVVQDPRTHENIEVSWDEQTKLPEGSDFQVGDKVGAMGEFVDGVFRAEGIHEGGMRWQQKVRPLERKGDFFRDRDREFDPRFRN